MRQIYDQLENIRRRWLFSTDSDQRSRYRDRYLRAANAADRYVNNITSQRSYQIARRSGPMRTAEDYNAAQDRADRLRFSRRTYMGLNNG